MWIDVLAEATDWRRSRTDSGTYPRIGESGIIFAAAGKRWCCDWYGLGGTGGGGGEEGREAIVYLLWIRDHRESDSPDTPEGKEALGRESKVAGCVEV